MRVTPLKAKTRSRFLACGLFLIGLSAAAELAVPPVDGNDPAVTPAFDRATASAPARTSADSATHCKRAG